MSMSKCPVCQLCGYFDTCAYCNVKAVQDEIYPVAERSSSDTVHRSQEKNPVGINDTAAPATPKHIQEFVNFIQGLRL